eukprot:scaffold413725_cov44-Prasinocladus_malaysianus.AAC.2
MTGSNKIVVANSKSIDATAKSSLPPAHQNLLSALYIYPSSASLWAPIRPGSTIRDTKGTSRCQQHGSLSSRLAYQTLLAATSADYSTSTASQMEASGSGDNQTAPAGDFDKAENHGNIALMEHINLNTDQPLECITFFVDGLGFVHDPRMGQLVDGKVYIHKLIWVNAGLTQVHLPITSRGALGASRNKVDGVVGLAYEDIDALCERLEAVAPQLTHTDFRWSRLDENTVEVYDPMGN